MAFMEKEEFMKMIQSKIGDDDSDETLEMLENVSDTYDELVRRSSNMEDWETKYKENDEMWRNKYKERFFTTPTEVIENQKKDIKRDSEVHTFEELFEEKEG